MSPVCMRFHKPVRGKESENIDIAPLHYPIFITGASSRKKDCWDCEKNMEAIRSGHRGKAEKKSLKRKKPAAVGQVRLWQEVHKGSSQEDDAGVTDFAWISSYILSLMPWRSGLANWASAPTLSHLWAKEFEISEENIATGSSLRV